MSENVLTPKQTRAIAALLTARTATAAAAAAGISERQLSRWLADDASFRRALREAEAATIDHAARRLAGLQATALDVLGDMLTRANVSATVRVRAAALIVELSIRLRELRSFEERLARVEEVIAGVQHAQHKP